MDEIVKSCARLEVSISFGRFENDHSLSWDKWSYFSPNKYLDEIGKLSTPGSVAKKKAYFEAHYSRIAARKAEKLEQEKSMNVANICVNESRNDDHVQNSSAIDAEFSLSNSEELIKEVANEAKDDKFVSCEAVEQEASINGFMDVITTEEENECAKNELSSNIVDNELDVRLEGALVEVEILQKDSKQIKEKPRERKNGVKQSTSSLRMENSKSNARHVAQKVTSTKKERNLGGIKKKAVPPALPVSTPRPAKTTSTSTTLSSKKKLHGSPSPKSNSFLGKESKRATPSLHMSLSLGPINPPSALSMTRKSLIMEKTRDKDVVGQAFQNRRPNGSSAAESSNTRKQVSYTTLDANYRKGNERLKNDAEIQRSQSGTRSKHLPSRSQKSCVVDKEKNSSYLTIFGKNNCQQGQKC